MTRAAAPPSGASDRREQGAVILEFALVTVVFLLMLWGIISYGAVFALHQSMTFAASEGARAAVGAADPAAVAEQATIQRLDWLGSRAADLDVDVTVAPCGYAPDLECVSVVVTYPYRDAPIVPPILDIAVPQQLRAAATVQL